MQIASVFSQFWRIRLDLDLSDSEIALFFAILSEINRARAENNNLLESEVQIGNPKLELLVGLSTRQISRLRNRLKQIGLIDFKPGKGKGSYAVYCLGKLFRNLDTDVQVNVQDNVQVSKNLDTHVQDNVQVNPNLDIHVQENDNLDIHDQDNVQVNVQVYDQVNVQRNKNIEKREERKENKNNKNNISPNGDMCSQACEHSTSSTAKICNQSSSKSDSKSDRTPYQTIVELYHRFCPSLPRVKVLNDTRKRYIRARWKEYPDIKFWEEFFKRVEESDFLTGRADYGKRRPFIADLEWLMRPSNFAKVLEGKYDNRKNIDPELRALAQQYGLKIK